VVRSTARQRIEVEQGGRDFRRHLRAEAAQQPGLAGAADTIEHDDRQQLCRWQGEETFQDIPFAVPIGEVTQFLAGWRSRADWTRHKKILPVGECG
jgi:hypothetical protein